MEKDKIIKIVIGVVVIGMVIAGVWLYRGQNKVPQGEVIKATFACAEGKIIEAEFDNLVPSDTKVRLKLSDGRNLSLPRAISGSGARYTNADESIVFWNKGDNAFIAEKDVETYSNCTVASTNNPPSILPYNSGVEGVVTLGPTCPVMKNPPDPACADKPYATDIQVIRANSSKSSPFATTKSDKDGKYKIMLPPGDYALQPVGASVLPRCQTQNVTIEPAKIITLNLSCDSGIR